jgi:hypothetical protein
MVEEMLAFTAYATHVVYHKQQMRLLHASFKRNKIIVKADFIQNISHSRGRETAQSYYRKRQTQFLVFVVWYWDARNNSKKVHLDYLSSYLKHNSLYFQKCLEHLLNYVRNMMGIEFEKVGVC